MGMGIGAIATCIGLVFAYVTGWLIKKYPFIQLPDVYYVSHLPIEINFEIFLLVFGVMMLLTFIAILIPIHSTQDINIANVLRHEA